MTIIGNHMVADEGKIFRRISTQEEMGDEIWLGYSHYIGGVKQDPPHLDVPEDFEEIDRPEEEESGEGDEEDFEIDDTAALKIILGNETE